MLIRPVRSEDETKHAAGLMRGLVEANKLLYSDDLEIIEEYYRGAWFFAENPEVPAEYCPPRGDVLVAYLDGNPVGTVATYRMNETCCELKSMFVTPTHRKQGVDFPPLNWSKVTSLAYRYRHSEASCIS